MDTEQLAVLFEERGQLKLAHAYCGRCLRTFDVAAKMRKAEAEAEAASRRRKVAAPGSGEAEAEAEAEGEAEGEGEGEGEGEVAVRGQGYVGVRVGKGGAGARGGSGDDRSDRERFVEATCASRQAALLEEVRPDQWREQAVELYRRALRASPGYKAAESRLRELAPSATAADGA